MKSSVKELLLFYPDHVHYHVLISCDDFVRLGTTRQHRATSVPTVYTWQHLIGSGQYKRRAVYLILVRGIHTPFSLVLLKRIDYSL